LNVLELNAELMFKLAGDPAIYAAAPFLEPMRLAAFSKVIHHKGGCSGCQRGAFLRDAGLVAAAMTRLLHGAYLEDKSRLMGFKKTSLKILNNPAGELLIKFKINGKDHQIQF